MLGNRRYCALPETCTHCLRGSTSSRSEVLMARGLQGGQMANTLCTIHVDMQRRAQSANAGTKCPAESTRPSACEWKWTGCMQAQQRKAQNTDEDLTASPTVEKSMALLPSTTAASETSEFHEATGLPKCASWMHRFRKVVSKTKGTPLSVLSRPCQVSLALDDEGCVLVMCNSG